MFSITSGVSLWYRPCYKNMLNYDKTRNAENLQYKSIYNIYSIYNIILFDCRTDNGFPFEHYLG